MQAIFVLMRRITRIAQALVLLAPVAGVVAQERPVQQPYTAAAARAVVDSFARLLRDRYADADTGRMIAAYLTARAEQGTYGRLKDWGQFLRTVSTDAQHINGDRHLFVDFAPSGGTGGRALPGGHGVEEVARLEGNIGYLRLSHFLGQQLAVDAVVGALRILETSDAMIIDLRNSRGGAVQLSNLLISHFVAPDTVPSLVVYNRVTGATEPRYIMREVPGRRRLDVPLFILVDDVSRSAAEDLPFVLQNMKRATVIGERTAGAGRNNATYPLGHGLIGSVSYTRVMDPRTRREWERVGVVPDIQIRADSAPLVAHVEALRALISKTSDTGAKRRLELLLEWVRARGRSGSQRAAADLSRFVGTYDGGQTITIRDGKLVYQPRVALPRLELTPLTASSYATGAMRILFREDGAGGLTLTLVDEEGRVSTASKTGGLPSGGKEK